MQGNVARPELSRMSRTFSRTREAIQILQVRMLYTTQSGRVCTTKDIWLSRIPCALLVFGLGSGLANSPIRYCVCFLWLGGNAQAFPYTNSTKPKHTIQQWSIRRRLWSAPSRSYTEPLLVFHPRIKSIGQTRPLGISHGRQLRLEQITWARGPDFGSWTTINAKSKLGSNSLAGSVLSDCQSGH